MSIVDDLFSNAGLFSGEAHPRHMSGAPRRGESDDRVELIAHDLRSVLANATWSLDALEEQADSRSESRRHVTILRRACRRIERLADELSDRTALEQRSHLLRRKHLCLAPLLGEIIDTFRAPATHRGLVLACEVDDHLPRVMADPDRLVQVFSNLLANAVNIVPFGGRVEVHATTTAERSHVLVRIEDDGPGIALDELPMIFDRHWRSPRAGYAGSGLGLAIARELVEAHGGSLRVESTLGRGTAFYVALPAET